MGIFDMINAVIRPAQRGLEVTQQGADSMELRALHRLAAMAHHVTLMRRVMSFIDGRRAKLDPVVKHSHSSLCVMFRPVRVPSGGQL